MSSTSHDDRLRTLDGAELFFQVTGRGTRGVVLCDGLGCDGFAWKYLLPRLSEEHRVVRWHYRGHGLSGVPEDRSRVGMEYTCADLTAVMQAAGLSQAVLFGHSMGVQVALEYHRRHPDQVQGLVLICGSYGRPLDTFHDSSLLKTALPYLKRAVERFPLASGTLNRVLMSTELVMQLALSLETNRELMKQGDLKPYFEHLAKMDPLLFVRTLESLSDHTAYEHLPSVNVPTLVVGGERDKFTPAWLSRRMAAEIPHASLLMVQGGTHTTPLEAPDLVWEHVQRFLETRIQPSPTRRARAKAAAKAIRSRSPTPPKRPRPRPPRSGE